MREGEKTEVGNRKPVTGSRQPEKCNATARQCFAWSLQITLRTSLILASGFWLLASAPASFAAPTQEEFF